MATRPKKPTIFVRVSNMGIDFEDGDKYDVEYLYMYRGHVVNYYSLVEGACDQFAEKTGIKLAPGESGIYRLSFVRQRKKVKW